MRNKHDPRARPSLVLLIPLGLVCLVALYGVAVRALSAFGIKLPDFAVPSLRKDSPPLR